MPTTRKDAVTKLKKLYNELFRHKEKVNFINNKNETFIQNWLVSLILLKEDNNSVEYLDDEFKVKIHKQKGASTSKKVLKLITPKLTAVLDRTKASDRQAKFIISVAAKSIDVDINSLAYCCSLIKLHHIKLRQNMANFINRSFSLN